jgi:hypothetical protein
MWIKISLVRKILGRDPIGRPDQEHSRTTDTLLNLSYILSAIHTTSISVTTVFNHRSPSMVVRGLRFQTVCSRGCGIYYPFTPLHPACIAARLDRAHERATSQGGSRQRMRSTKEGKRMKSFESPGATPYSPFALCISPSFSHQLLILRLYHQRTRSTASYLLAPNMPISQEGWTIRFPDGTVSPP